MRYRDRSKNCRREAVSCSVSGCGQYLGWADRGGGPGEVGSGGGAAMRSERLVYRVLQVKSETGVRQHDNYLACFEDGGSGRLVQVRGSGLVANCR